MTVSLPKSRHLDGYSVCLKFTTSESGEVYWQNMVLKDKFAAPLRDANQLRKDSLMQTL